MVLKSIAILLVGAALGTGLQFVVAANLTSASVDASASTSSSNSHSESIVAMTAESFLAADRLPPALSLAAQAIETPDIEATCAGSLNATGQECDNGLEPTLVPTPATTPALDRRAAGEQPSPENYVVGCAGGADATGNDCM